MADPLTRARNADRLLRDEELQAALQRIEDTAVAEWKIGSSTPEQREEAWMMVRTVEAFRIELKIVLDNGAHETDRIEREKRRQHPI